LFEVTSGQCSCSLIVQDSSPPFEEKRARLQAQYERKGWSRAKIARALSDWENAHERTAKARNDPKERLCALLRVLGSRPGGVRVLVHFYSNAFDSEEIRVTGNFNIHVDQLIHTGVLTEDKLVGVLPQR
jgi:hypothetical protein